VERALYPGAARDGARAAQEGIAPFYCCSLSRRTVVYKALLTGAELPAFYPDLRDPAFASAIAVFHERYATNTLPRWELVQPFRLLAHNGEINTLWANRKRLRHATRDARGHPPSASASSGCATWSSRRQRLGRARQRARAAGARRPVARARADDARAAGVGEVPRRGSRPSGVHEYHQCVIEPWDGPGGAGLHRRAHGGVLSLDRNGRRPCRYTVRADGLVVAGSEVGIVDLDPQLVVESGRAARVACSSSTPCAGAWCATSTPSARSPRAAPTRSGWRAT
jgi:glutamate synthase domain-containing protein 1